MKKTGLFLRIGLVALITAGQYTVSFGQQSAKKPGRKDVEVRVSTPAKAQVTNVGKQQKQKAGVVKPVLNSKLASQKRGAVASTNAGSGARNCTPKTSLKPYSISRQNFNNLPKDRKEFVLKHSDKYTIVD